jgi:predicted dehydrogenase
MDERIPIGIVGLNFGRHIVEQLATGHAAELFRIAALCDQDRDKADARAAKVGAKPYYDLDELLTDDAIPTIGLFTGPVGRAELIRRCIRAGKDVMTTKPFEADPDAALGVLCEAQKLGRVVHLNSPAPLLPPDLAQIQAWRDEFQLGRPIACRADVWVRYHEQADGSWYDNPQKCPVAPIFRLGIYLINDLIRLFGAADKVQVLHSRLFTGRPTPDNAQLGILFKNGAVANVFASFCVEDGDHYRNGLTLNFERGTIYRNVGPQRTGRGSELSLVMARGEEREVVAQAEVLGGNGAYQWEAFARAIRGENLKDAVTPKEIVAGLHIIEAMACADAGNGVADVRSTHDG